MTINNSDLLSLSDADQKKLEALIDDYGKNINKDNKFKFITGVKSHFLPEVKEIFDFCGIKTDPKSFYQALSGSDIDVPNISNSSLHELGRNGVGKAVFKKFMATMVKASPSIVQLLIPGKDEWVDRAFKTNSNAGGWFGLINQYRRMRNDERYDQQELAIYQYLIDFITLRCQQEIKFHESIKHKKLSFDIDLDDRINIWRDEVKPFYKQNTNLGKTTLAVVDEVMAGAVNIPDLNYSQKVDTIRKIFELEYDFVLNCIACYEFGYVKQHHGSSELKKWLISNMLEAYTEPSNRLTCFHCLIKVLQKWLKQHGIIINNRQLASCIPINYQNRSNEDSEGCKESKNDAQCNILYKWYRNIDLPSSESLDCFFDNLSLLSQCPIDNGPFYVAKIAIGFDKLLANQTDIIQKEFGSDIDVEAIWKQALSRYSDCYYYHFHNDFLIKE